MNLSFFLDFNKNPPTETFVKHSKLYWAGVGGCEGGFYNVVLKTTPSWRARFLILDFLLLPLGVLPHSLSGGPQNACLFQAVLPFPALPILTCLLILFPKSKPYFFLFCPAEQLGLGCVSWPTVVVLKQEPFWSPGDIWQCLQTYLVATAGNDTGTDWVKSRDATDHAVIHRTAPAPNKELLRSTEIKKLRTSANGHVLTALL